MDVIGPEPRLVLVTSVNVDECYAVVLLMSPDTFMGTQVDMYLDGSSAGLRYDLLAHTDLKASAWFVQLSPPLGKVSDKFLRLCDTRAATRQFRQLRDDRDVRWAWKEQELVLLRQLTHECTKQLLGEPRLILDPLALDPLVVSRAMILEIAAEVAEGVRSGRVVVPTGKLLSDEMGTAQIWRESGVLDAYTLFAHAAIAAVGQPHPQARAASNVVIGGLALDASDELTAMITAEVESGRSSVQVLTPSFPRRIELTAGQHRALVASVSGVRCQIVPTDIGIDDSRMARA